MTNTLARLDAALSDRTANVTIATRRGDPWILMPRLVLVS
ncbi:hypothetical protein LAUMK191_03040 [Mycobacterium attenuatum]|uniref:Uncharacterized protein n=1 Tax=Mycobacterium attenuatum TaxID=2341086 RepID=A0A498Q716_9MYCO|nr:hypothetical protein LAUMK136_03069 [Mycobacterium attenuatum]VBA54120.1 hypothetical protein LAUMK191_03040 [Mycobacterium attenuatum]VBA58687.1 hypothetical protein LAUMK41_03116 [Mycobacterium attenuatum]